MKLDGKNIQSQCHIEKNGPCLYFGSKIIKFKEELTSNFNKIQINMNPIAINLLEYKTFTTNNMLLKYFTVDILSIK